MGKFYLTDGRYLIATGSCPDGLEKRQAHGTYQVKLGEPPAGLKPKPAPADGYDKQRAAAYPPVEAQMDMLWHAMHQGNMPKIEPFYSNILAVKQRYPKPSN